MKKYVLLCTVLLASPASMIFADAGTELAKKTLKSVAEGESTEAPVEQAEATDATKCACGNKLNKDSEDATTRSCSKCCKCKTCCKC